MVYAKEIKYQICKKIVEKNFSRRKSVIRVWSIYWNYKKMGELIREGS